VRVIYLIIVILHGLIHLLGFLKAYGISEVKEMTLPVSKPAGLFWLITGLSFLVYGALFLSRSKFNWIAGLIAILISQFLLFQWWSDAGFGTILNLVIFAVVLVNYGKFRINRKFDHFVRHDFENNNSQPTEILTEHDLVHLPPAVQKYVRYTGSVGKPRVKNFRAEFTGGMRSGPGDDYMKVKSVQYNFYRKPSRFFFMTAVKTGLPATGLHIYQNEKATFKVKMLNLFPIINASGDQMNQAETVTLFNDMCFIAPATLIDQRIAWEQVDDLSVRAIFTNGSLSIIAVLYFNEKGELINFISKDRFETDGKIYNNYPWATPVSDYREINGYILPGKARLIYQRPEGDFTYGELEYKDVKYNLDQMEK
jgi:hypothetical protein